MEKRFNHREQQARLIEEWENRGTYTLEQNPGPLYSIDTPPPTVSGSLHIGHIFSYTQTDIIARFNRMCGSCVYYPFGFDNNGLPTERFVEKATKTSAGKIGRSEFTKLCLTQTAQTERIFKELWQTIGLSVDWKHCYSTISERSRRLSQESFIRLYNDGFVYRKHEPALYCTTCRTSVAQAELDDIEKPSTFYDIVFYDEKGNDLTIATTRPELLPACVALFYHPDDPRYKHLAGTTARVPIFGHTVPIIADEMVQQEKGSGLVMCCTFGDKTDIMWFKTHNLAYRQAIGFNGRFTEETGPLAGLKAVEARNTIIELLKNHNLVLQERPIVHAINVHERCKNPIEYVMISQWFIRIMEHKQIFIDLAHKINWYPEHMKSRYMNWVENIGWDWCISRQRVYGIPFPAWHCKACNHIILASIEQLPLDPQEVKPPINMCPTCQSTDIIPDTDVMDTWNTSSLTPYICADMFTGKTGSPFENESKLLPMTMRPQAHDIIRTWLFYTIVKSWMHSKEIPWHNVVISGHVLSPEKEKLSKSKGNAFVAPEQLLERYPADAIRYWTASGGLGHDIAFSDSQLKIGQRLVTKLWNAFRFIGMHTETKQPISQPPAHLGIINQWIIDRAAATHQAYSQSLRQHEFNAALVHIERFFWSDLCDNYLELIKHQLFNTEEYDEQQVESTLWTLAAVGFRALQFFAPYLPYVTDAIYQEIYGNAYGPSIHNTRFGSIDSLLAHYPEASESAAWILNTVAAVRKLKSEKQLSLKTPLHTLTISAPGKEVCNIITAHQILLKGVCQAEAIHCITTPPTTALQQSQITQNEQGQWSAHITLDTAHTS